MYRLLVVAVGAGLAVMTAPVALASARYVSSNPEAGGFVTSPPSTVRVIFDDEVKSPGSNISVVAPGGAEVNDGPVALDPMDSRALVVPLKSELANGLYTVRWSSVSARDGTTSSGSFNFGLRVGAAPPVVQLEHETVEVGQRLGISGSGFKPHGTIVVSAGDDDGFVDAGRADADGRYRGVITVPADLPFGKQTITVADGDGAKASQDVQVRWGGWPPVKAAVTADTAKDQMTFTVNLFNRSDYHLMVDAARLRVPDGSRFKNADSGGRLTAAGEASWDAIDLPAHGSAGPFSLVVDTTQLADGTDVTGWVWALYHHDQEADEDGTLLLAFTSSVISKPASARAGGLQH